MAEIKILVASDIHLGYAERDIVRKRDSIDTFEEVLQIADREQVDMLLLGGDLFHENKPSRSTLYSCTELLRKYCMNDRPISLEFLSDPSVNFDHSSFPNVNYLDPNVNIGLPVFSINGNHDDLSATGLSALDQLHATGLINYFGKYHNLEKLDVSPILLKKTDAMGNETKIALYGIGSIRDERLHRLFQANKVTFLTFDDEREQRSWFNILVVHQNRVKHGMTNYIPEHFLPEFMDLVIWGHEHPCRIKPEESAAGFKIIQPGSTVATSLAEGEAGEKCVTLLRITQKGMTDEVITLKTIRPFYFENIVLSELNITPGHADTVEKIEKYCDGRVKQYLERAEREHPDNPLRTKPLIRLRVDYSGDFDTFKVHRFGNKYVDVVANPKDIVLFHKKREQKERTGVDLSVLSKVMKQNAQELRGRVEDLVKNYFSTVDKSNKLVLLTDNALGAAVTEFVEKDEKDSIDEMVKQQLARIQKKVEEQLLDRDNPDAIKTFIEEIRDLRIQQNHEDNDELDGIKEALEASRRRRRQQESSGSTRDENNLDGDQIDDDNPMEEIEEPLFASTPIVTSGTRSRGRGRGGRASTSRGRRTETDVTAAQPSTSGGRRGRGRGRGRGVKRPLADDSDDFASDGVSTGRMSTSGAKRAVRRNLPPEDDVEIIDDEF